MFALIPYACISFKSNFVVNSIKSLNKSKNRITFPSNVIINNVSVEDSQEIANDFNRFFVDVGSDLSNKIVVDNDSSKLTDYLIHPTNLN